MKGGHYFEKGHSTTVQFQMQGAGRRQSTFLLLGQRVVEYLKQHLDELRRPMSSRPLLHDERGHEVAAMKLKVPPRVW